MNILLLVFALQLMDDGDPLKVRESLEEQTMNMAKAAAKLFQDNICYSNGEPVKVIIADSTIGRVPEATACAEKFRREGVDITLTVTPCWCYGSETMDMDAHTIKGVWGFKGTERPSAIYLAAVLAGHAQKRGFLPSVFMVTMFRMLMQQKFLRMYVKNCSVSDVLL